MRMRRREKMENGADWRETGGRSQPVFCKHACLQYNSSEGRRADGGEEIWPAPHSRSNLFNRQQKTSTTPQNLLLRDLQKKQRAVLASDPPHLAKGLLDCIGHDGPGDPPDGGERGVAGKGAGCLDGPVLCIHVAAAGEGVFSFRAGVPVARLCSLTTPRRIGFSPVLDGLYELASVLLKDALILGSLEYLQQGIVPSNQDLLQLPALGPPFAPHNHIRHSPTLLSRLGNQTLLSSSYASTLVFQDLLSIRDESGPSSTGAAAGSPGSPMISE